MAKRRNRRDDSSIANRRLPEVEYTKRRSQLNTPNLRIYEDRRLWHPEGINAPAGVLRQRSARVFVEATTPQRRTPAASRRGFSPRMSSPITAFTEPKEVLVCVRRSQRREVLHALKRTGAGTSSKKPKLTWRSKISCRRK